MKVKCILLAALFYFVPEQVLYASKIDSLIQIQSSQTDTTRINTLNDICFELAYYDISKAKAYGMQALALSKKFGYKKGEMRAYTRIGIAYDIASDFDSALWYYDKALLLATSVQDKKGQASALNNKAMVFSNRGLYPKAMVMYLNALRLFEQLHDTLNTANALNNIAVLYNDMVKDRQSLVYATKALNAYTQLNNKRGMAASYTNIAMAYGDQNKDSFYKYISLSISLKQQINDQFGLGISYNDLCVFFINNPPIDSAIFYGKKAIAIKRSLNDEFGEASCLINLSKAYQAQHNFKVQKICLDSAFEIAWKLQSNRLLNRVTFGLSSAYRNLGDYQTAYRYLRWHGEFRDSLMNEENNKNLNELEARYQSEKKDLIINNTNLALQASEANVGRNRAQITLLAVTLTLVIISALFIYFAISSRQKRKLAQQTIIQEQLRNKAVISAEDEERKRIAKDLHDGVGQQLSAVKMNLSAYASQNEVSGLNDIMNMLDEAVREVRNVSHSMVPNALLHAGLASALRDFMNKVAAGGNIQVDVQMVGIKERLDEQKETTLYRIVQECVSNVIKHAHATRLTLQLIHHPGHLTLMIEDNGVGFDFSSIKHGLGIRNIESRVNYINGQLNIDSSPGKGTTISVNIPH